MFTSDVTFDDVRKYVDENFNIDSKVYDGIPLFSETPQDNIFIKHVARLLKRSGEKVLWIVIFHPPSSRLFFNGMGFQDGILVATTTRFLYFEAKIAFLKKLQGKPPKISQTPLLSYKNIASVETKTEIRTFYVSIASEVRVVSRFGTNEMHLRFEETCPRVSGKYNCNKAVEEKEKTFKSWKHLFQITINAKSVDEIEKIKQERKKKEDEGKKRVKRVRKWYSEGWSNITGDVVKVKATLNWAHNEILDKVNDEPMALDVHMHETIYHIPIEYQKGIAILKNKDKRTVYRINYVQNSVSLKLFYFEQSWYCVENWLELTDGIILIENTWVSRQWTPESWADDTNSVEKASATLYWIQDEFEKKTSKISMMLGVESEDGSWWKMSIGHVEGRKIALNSKYETVYSREIAGDEKEKGMKFFYYGEDWYRIRADISLEDGIALIEAIEIRKQQKIQKEKERLQKKIEEAKMLVGGKRSNGKKRRKGIPKDVQMFVWNRDGGRCVQCGSNEKLEYDHIIPFSKGGSDTARNLQLLCEKCNRQKGNNIG